MGRVFVTGMYRSGTTLLEKLLHSIEAVSVASQPLPLLYVEVKRAFLSSLGSGVGHPLGHLFLEDRYTPEQFDEFIRQHVLDADYIYGIRQRLREAAGLQAAEALEVDWEFQERARFHDVRHRISGALAAVYGKPDAEWIGSKEIICEEYIPHLLQIGERVVVIVRNPHDVLASIYLGQGPSFAGKNRPTLFHLRNWRKSVAFCLANLDHPGFQVVRYEDLVARPQETMIPVLRLLGQEDAQLPPLSDLRDQQGKPWLANSSFTHRTPRHEHLPSSVSAYVDLVCRPEMQALGYRVESEKPDSSVLEHLVEPREVTDPLLSSSYSTDPVRLERELRRLAFLKAQEAPQDVRHWFIEEAAFRRLARAVALHQ